MTNWLNKVMSAEGLNKLYVNALPHPVGPGWSPVEGPEGKALGISVDFIFKKQSTLTQIAIFFQ